MAVNNTQYLSFLGGLVSPRLWLRSDMDKFGKWFATADNIRFHTVGSFENRFGTIKVGNTYRNTAGENIKLIKFDFGQGETCMLELGSGYFRVVANGKYILDENDVPLVFNTQIVLSDSDDIKYVQSGDIIFLTNSKGIYEIKRKAKDFTDWEIVSFEFKDGITPFGDENDNDSSFISISSQDVPVVSSSNFVLELPIREDVISGYTTSPSVDIEITSGGVTTRTNVYSYNGDILDTTFIYNLNSALSSYNVTVAKSGSKLTFDCSNNADVSNIYLHCLCYKKYVSQNLGTNWFFLYDSQKMLGIRARPFGGEKFLELDAPYPLGSNDSILAFNSKFNIGNVNSSYKLESNTSNTPTAFRLLGYNIHPLASSIWSTCEYSVEYFSPDNYDVTAERESSSGRYYNSTASFQFFASKQNSETFMVRNEVSADYIHATKTGYTTTAITTETSAPPTVVSNGFWRYNSSGLWSGEVTLQYSTDNGSTWITFFNRKNSSYSNYSTTNDNTSGTIKTDCQTLLLKMVVSNIAEDNASKFSAELAVDKFEVNSVYKIYNITANNTAVVECVKGDIGEFTNNSQWREAEFSYANGYPTAIGFYKNRLFLGKEYRLYSSRINDFWDFYEPIEVADDDPMTMSLLSYKVNNIQNLIGIRSFFVFTSGGEFGIGAEGGALTQATKYLKQISAHGSNSCNPIFCGDIIVFVDKTNNTVRAFRYSLEADGWEATDVSVLIEQVLEGKKIITTEYMQDTKECLFLTDEGEVYVFKFFQEQNISAWSVWKHAKYKITNLCVLEDSLGKDILYIAVNTDTGMQIEQFSSLVYADSVVEYSSDTAFSTITTDFQENDKVVVNDGTDLYLAEVGEDGVVSLRNTTSYATVGLSYTSIATLLSPEIQDRDGTFSTFNRKRPFKVFAFHRDSYGFKVGVEEENKQEPQWQPIWSTADEETALTTGKTSVPIPSRYNGSSRVSFVQDKPYPMIIENVLLETDYGGK